VVNFSATGVTITGDNTANTVVINDTGTGLVGSITVTADGVTSSNAVLVTAFQYTIETLGGNDTVIYNLTGDLLTGQTRSLLANLGDRNDTFLATAVEVGGLSSDLNTGSALSFAVNGQIGRDNLFFDFTKDPDINGTAALSITALGGRDRDKIALNYEGAVDGTFTHNLNGNQDADRVSSYVTLDGGSAGAFVGQVNGQAANDLLALVVNKSTTFTGTATGTMDGGGGVNAGIASNFVDVEQVQNLFQLPF
jgi:hypothetical protein